MRRHRGGDERVAAVGAPREVERPGEDLLRVVGAAAHEQAGELGQALADGAALVRAEQPAQPGLCGVPLPAHRLEPEPVGGDVVQIDQEVAFRRVRGGLGDPAFDLVVPARVPQVLHEHDVAGHGEHMGGQRGRTGGARGQVVDACGVALLEPGGAAGDLAERHEVRRVEPAGHVEGRLAGPLRLPVAVDAALQPAEIGQGVGELVAVAAGFEHPDRPFGRGEALRGADQRPVHQRQPDQCLGERPGPAEALGTGRPHAVPRPAPRACGRG